MFIQKRIVAAAFGTALFLLSVCMCYTNVYAQEEATAPSATTLNNLKTIYEIDSNAQARYLAFAEKANEEGYDVAASLFRASALAQQVHYKRYAELIEKLGGTATATTMIPVVKTTRENLEAALIGETYEKDVMYPAFIIQAEKDNNIEAVDAFEDARAADNAHAELYASMIENLELSKELEKKFYVCPVCGNILDALTTRMCPICKTDTQKFTRIK